MSTEVAKPTRTLTIRDHLQGDVLKGEIAKVLPKHCSADRMARVALTAITRTPELAECDQASFFRCLMDLSQWGLEPDGRHAHLIPFKNKSRGVTECQVIIDYKGMVALCFRSGKVKSLHADVIYDGDIFRFNLGQVEEHIPWVWRMDADRPAERGNRRGVFCIAKMADGADKCEVMSEQEVKAIQSRSRAGGAGPWKTDFNEMAKKTVFRRATKWLPLSAEVVEAMQRDADTFPPLRVETRDTPIQAGLAALKERMALADARESDGQTVDGMEGEVIQQASADTDPDLQEV